MLRDDTLVILSNDNVGLRRSGDFKWPLRTRGAAFVYGKLLQQKGVKNTELLPVTDWYPTLISLAGED